MDDADAAAEFEAGTISIGESRLGCADAHARMAIRAYSRRMAFTRISIDHRIMSGAPCIAGTRIPVAMIVRMIAAGTSQDEVLADYPQLVADDIREALRFAAANLDDRIVPLTA